MRQVRVDGDAPQVGTDDVGQVRVFKRTRKKNGATNARKAVLSSHEHVTRIKFSSSV